MATKAEIQAKIDAIGDGQENTALEVRTFANGLLDEFFTTPIVDSYLTETITSKIFANLQYDLTFKKTGNVCVIIGKIKLLSDTALIQDLIAITDSEYAPNDDFVQEFKIDGIFIQVNNGKIRTKASITASSYWINISYVTN